MGAISAGDQALLRNQTDPQYTIERLYSFGFPTMWTGRINNASIARGDQTIAYDGGALAAGFVFGNLVAGLEIWIGSAAGLKDIGRARILSISGVEASGTIIIDWSDDKNLADDQYLTIKHVFPPSPKLSWFTATGPDFRKDGPPSGSGGAGLDYTDENELPPPHVIMGRHYANELPAAGSLVVQLNAASSVAVASGASISTYLWAVVPSGPTISNTAIANPTITFTGNGRWWVSCTVTDDNGNSSTGYRAYRIGGGVTEFSRGPYTSQFDGVDVNLNFTITSPSVTWADFDDRALIILAAEDYFGSTQKTISFRDTAVYTGHQHIMFAGYLTLENDDLTEDGVGQFQMTAVSTLDMYLYSLSITGEATATDWYEMDSTLMTVAGNLFHLFKYHSTLLDIMDWWLPWSDTTKRSANELFTAGNLLEKARALIRSRLMAMTATPQGEIFVEANLNLQDSATRSAETTTITLTDVDVANVKRVRVRRRGEVVRVLLSGGSSSGLLGTFVPYLSASHDVARAEGRPSTPSYDTLMLASQTEANNFAGRLAQVANATYQEINLDFSGNYREVFSPADQQWTNLGTIAGSSQLANLRAHTDLESLLCIPRQVTVAPPGSGFAQVNVIFEIEAPEGLSGVTLPQPTVPSSDIADNDFDPPDPPAWPAPEPPTTVPFTSTGTLYSFDDTNGCYIRRSTDSDWSARNGSLSGTSIQDQQGGFDPWWFTADKQNTTNVEQSILWKLDVGQIFRSTDGGATWVDVTPIDDPPNTWGDGTAPTVADLTFVCRTDNIHTNGEHYFLAYQSASNRGWLLKTTDDGVTWSWKPLLSIEYDGTYFYPTAVVAHCTTGFGDAWRYTDQANMTGQADGLTGYWEKNPGSCSGQNSGGFMSAILDLGISISAMQLEARTRGDVTVASVSVRVTNDDSCSADPSCVAWTNDAGLGDAWYAADAALTWNSLGTASGGPYRYVRLACDATSGDSAGVQLHLDTIRVQGTAAFNEVIPIWMDTDTQDGSTLWITLWDGTDIVLQKRNTSDLVLQETYILGTVSEIELNAKTYIAYPFTPAFNKSVVYIYGRMNAPQSLANPEHIIRTVDGGTTWTSVENGFGADYVGALQAWDDDGLGINWHLAFVRNVIAGSTGEFYKGVSHTLRSTTPFQVNQDALTLKDTDIAIGAIAAVGGVAVAVSTDSGATWGDATGTHPAGSSGEIKSLVYV